MGRIKGEAARIVEAHGGVVNQFVGDEVLALFGIPTAHEDDPVGAVRAALALHDIAREVSREVEARIGQPIRFHSGINTGLIVTRSGDLRDGTYGVTGDAVNTAAPLVALAAPDEVVLSPETQRLVADYFTAEPLEAVVLKGMEGVQAVVRQPFLAHVLRPVAGRTVPDSLCDPLAQRRAVARTIHEATAQRCGTGNRALREPPRYASRTTPLQAPLRRDLKTIPRLSRGGVAP